MEFKPKDVVLKRNLDNILTNSIYMQNLIGEISSNFDNKVNNTDLSKYQLKGDYITTSKASGLYQPIGDYATTSDLVKYVPLSDMVGYVKQGDLVKSNDDIRLDLSKKADKTELSNLQPKGEYINLEGLEEKLSEIKLEDTVIDVIAKDKKLSEVLVDLENTDKLLSEKQGTMQVELNGKALEIHKHSTSDITGLDELIASIELKDTAIDVIAEEKKLNVVLSELRNKDVEQSTEILNLKNELNGYVARHKVANDNIQKSIND